LTVLFQKRKHGAVLGSSLGTMISPGVGTTVGGIAGAAGASIGYSYLIEKPLKPIVKGGVQ